MDDLLTELFDNPYHKEYDEDMTKDTIRRVSSPNGRYAKSKISNVGVWKLEGDNGHLISWMKDGMYEVHHKPHEEYPDTNKESNPRFVSSMYHHLKEHAIPYGFPIRLSTTDSKLHKNFAKFSQYFAKKHDYSVKEKMGTLGNVIMFSHELTPNKPDTLIEQAVAVITKTFGKK